MDREEFNDLRLDDVQERADAEGPVTDPKHPYFAVGDDEGDDFEEIVLNEMETEVDEGGPSHPKYTRRAP